jgi:hypothetical protein
MVDMKNKKDNKFKIVCKECGSENTFLELNIDWDGDLNDFEIRCRDCNCWQNGDDFVAKK